MNELDRHLSELFDRIQPANRIANYREKVEQLETVTKLEPGRLAEIRAFVTERLDDAERIMQRESWNAGTVQQLLEESRHALINAVHEPNAIRGAKIAASARAGHEAMHGTRDEKEQKWSSYQSIVDEIADKNPALSWARIQQIAADRVGVHPKTIYRHCKNPKQS